MPRSPRSTPTSTALPTATAAKLPPPRRQLRRRAAAVAATVLLLSGGPAQALLYDSVDGAYDLHAAARDTSGPRRICQDFFCSVVVVVPPEEVVQDRQDSMSVRRNRFDTDPVPDAATVAASAAVAGATSAARAKLALGRSDVAVGVAASATKSSIFVSGARAGLVSEFDVHVELSSPVLLGALTSGACGGSGCTLAVDFLHQTTGRFAYSFSPGAGARASFSETLRIDGIARAAGEAFIEADPSDANRPAPGASGDWSTADFLAPQTDAAGTGWTFNHFAMIDDQRTTFVPSGLVDDFGNVLFHGTYRISLEQAAQADFGAFEYIVGMAMLSADFGNTSTFTPGRVYDPSGGLDLSDARVSLRFASVTPVPEPATWALFAAGLGLAGLRWRRHGTPGGAAG